MNLLEQLDQYAKDCNFPLWDNMNYTCGAMRALGLSFANNKKLLVFERIAYSKRENEIASTLYCYGDGIESPGYHGTLKTLVPSNMLVENIDDYTIRSRITNIVFSDKKSGREVTEPPAGMPEYFSLKFNDEKIKLRICLPSMREVPLKNAKFLKRLLPEEIILFQLCDYLSTDKLFSNSKAIVKFLILPEKADPIFDITNWEHPHAEESVKSFPDIVQMTQSIETGEPLGKLSGFPHGNWRYWLDETLKFGVKEDELNWPSKLKPNMLLNS